MASKANLEDLRLDQSFESVGHESRNANPMNFKDTFAFQSLKVFEFIVHDMRNKRTA